LPRIGCACASYVSPATERVIPLEQTVAAVLKDTGTCVMCGCWPCQCERPQKNDPVNHPSHYTSHPSGIECIRVTEHMNFNVGNAVKYLWRCDHKGSLISDLEKARWYIDREIARLKKP
jgi:hypothetical protein